MTILAFPDAIANERSRGPLHKDTPSAKLRRRFLRGEILNSADAEALGASRALLDQTVRVMNDWGFNFERSTGDDGKRYVRVTNPDHTPIARSGKLTRKRPLKAAAKRPAAVKAAAVKKAPAKKAPAPPRKAPPAKKMAAPAAPSPKPAANHLLPPTGSSLMVYVQKVDDDGGVILGLKSESGSWLARVEGYTEVELVPT